jgi:hypothetical protein
MGVIMRFATFGAAVIAAGLFVSVGNAMPIAPLGASSPAGQALDLVEPVACTRDGYRGVRVYRNCLRIGTSVGADPSDRWRANKARRKAHRASVAAAKAGAR